MQKKIHAAPARSMLTALVVALALAAGPATAEAKGDGQSAQAEAALIAPGAGYGDPQGSDRVRTLQRRLRRADASPGPVDGRFGPLTEAAVRRFESRKGIVADGLVGRSTRVALARTVGPLSNERRTDAAQANRHRPQSERTAAERNPGSEPEPTRNGAAAPTTGEADSENEAAGWGPLSAVLAALATLAAGALALALGLSGRRRHGGTDVDPEPVSEPSGPLAPTAEPGVRNGEPAVLGYALIPTAKAGVGRVELGSQAEAIAGECGRRGLRLLELVRDREPRNGKDLDRPGLGYALKQIAAGKAGGLVVWELAHLSRSASDLGEILDWFARSQARLVVAAQGLDTGEEAGLVAARALIEVSGWERERLSERTQKGLEAARLEGRFRRRAVADDPDLRDRIAAMRAAGMTLQSIADRLNEEGVPTVRGGALWRPSSVQAAAGYKRPRRAGLTALSDAAGQSRKGR